MRSARALSRRARAGGESGVRETTLPARRRLYEDARALVAARYRSELTVPRAARALACSPRSLQRAYAQFGETSFSEDLRDTRLRAAAQLLAQQPSLEVRQVARLVGAAAPAHFAAAFRRRYGLAPAEFRRAARAGRASRRGQ